MSYTKGLLNNFEFVLRQSLTRMTLCDKAFVKFLLRGELLHTQTSLFACEEVEFLEALTVRTIRKRDIHHLCICYSLL